MTDIRQVEAEDNKDGRRVAKILCVDDEQNILSSLKRVFRPDGYEVYTATSGGEGLQVLGENEIDLVISDMRMPEMDGSEFLSIVADKWPDTVRMLLTGYADLSSTIDAINKGRIYGYFSKPWDDDEIRLTIRRAIERRFLEEERDRLQKLTEEQNRKLQDWNDKLEREVQARTEELKQTNLFLELAYRELKESYYNAIPIFANLVQLREGEKEGHSKRVAELSREVADELQMDEDDRRHIYFAGLLHDIGTIGIPDGLLKLPYQRMNEKQRKVYERHPGLGAALLMGLEPLRKTAKFIRQHHESIDGKGYPDGLHGDEITLGARVVMACNEYDGLRYGGFFKDELSMADAIDFMRQRAGKRYDNDVINALIKVLEKRETQKDRVHEHRLEPTALQEGMRLSRDLLSSEGVLLLSKGHLLSDVLIEKIQAFSHDTGSALYVHVYAEGEDDESDHVG